MFKEAGCTATPYHQDGTLNSLCFDLGLPHYGSGEGGWHLHASWFYEPFTTLAGFLADPRHAAFVALALLLSMVAKACMLAWDSASENMRPK